MLASASQLLTERKEKVQEKTNRWTINTPGKDRKIDTTRKDKRTNRQKQWDQIGTDFLSLKLVCQQNQTNGVTLKFILF